MKLPLSWLKDYVALALTPAELVERFNVAGLEVSGTRVLGLPIPPGLRVKPEERGPIWDTDKIVIAQVLEVGKHPNADKLKIVKLDYGNGRVKDVVTGAPNINVGDQGQKVVLGLTGSVLFDGHSEVKKLVELKPTMLRGVPSDSMVCSAFELGIHEDHDGIILLGSEAPVGMPLQEYLGDIVLELEILPNMARCLSILGLAREVAALTGEQVCVPELLVPRGEESVFDQIAEVVIEDAALCPRYTASVIKNVTIGRAPDFMAWRLLYSGMRPIDLIVDITNYVMLEFGQPLHAFDYDALVERAGGKKPTIVVRPARWGESLRTLDKDKPIVELTPEMLIIADSVGPIALAGVKGGVETAVTNTTKNILLESACFDMVSIRRTVKALNFPSDAALRFSKGIHPELAASGAERAAQLLAKYAGGIVSAGMIDTYPGKPAPQVIDLQQSEIRRILGVEIPAVEVESILRALEFTVVPMADGWSVLTPPNRLDIQSGAADLIEELARIRGYDRLPRTLLATELPPQRGNRRLVVEEAVRDLLTNVGFDEAITYGLTTPAREALLGLPTEAYVRLLNPLTDERTVMRRSLLPNLFESLVHNLKNGDRVRLFELGFVYLPTPGVKLPKEPLRLALAATGPRSLTAWDSPLGVVPPAFDFYDLKGIIEALVAGLHLPKVTYRSIGSVPYLHPGRAAELLVRGNPAGVFGELHPVTAAAFDLRERTVLVADLDMEFFLREVPERFAYVPISRFPAALRDVAVIVDEAVPHEQVVAAIRAGGGDLLAGVRLFDVYRGDQVPSGKKSLAFALTFQAADRTLSDKEIDKAHEKVEGRLRQALKAAIRGKDKI